MSIAQKPIDIAAAVRTNSARVMLNSRRGPSVSLSASRMIASCCLVGGGGKYSSFEQGITSTGRSSDRSGHEYRYGRDVSEAPWRFQLITCSPFVPCGYFGTSLWLLRDLEGASH